MHCQSLHGALHDHYATTYGVNFESVLNESRYFHVTNGLVPDVMHDILEGCGPYEMKEMLKVMISSKYITLDDVNTRIENFIHADVEGSDKPSFITPATLHSRDHKLIKQVY